MSWLARSIANSLKLDDDDEVADKPETKPENPELSDDDDSSPTSPSRGVKEDISELTKTLTRNFWGVASFLAPPPQSESVSETETSEPDPDSISGIRTDFAEIGGKFRSGISRLSNNINVSEITKMASSFLQLESDDEDEKEGFDSVRKGAVGVTKKVVAFALDIAMHPETWLDFPLPEDVDFDLSEAQQEHALAVERLAPGLAALRIELCPEHMGESSFWMIYFVLLHPRLDKEAAELLSTPEILEARALLAHELKNQTAIKPEDSEKKSFDPDVNVNSRYEEPLSVPPPVSSENVSNKASNLEINASTAPETVKYPVENNQNQIVDKSVIEEKDSVQVKDQSLKSGSLNIPVQKDEDDADDWLKEETSETGGAIGTTAITIPIENEDDVSFSDLEEDDDGDVPTSYRKSNYSSDKDSRDWVQLGKTSSNSSKDIDTKHSDNENVSAHDTKESNDWLDVDDIDVA
ncbi:hypothetical protein ACJIZ3_002086 [Penstemon smallii]|uniref:BSD domain-containing protein n=1 Tax=Penstemon smallii TaxID=265156 RepID=A0ABD3U949_9LAMI